MTKAIEFSCLFFALLLLACNDDQEAKNIGEDFNETFKKLSEDLNTSVWEVRSDTELFQIEIPMQMRRMEELNATAKFEYGYYERFGLEVKENYILVMPHLLDELKIEAPNQSYTVENYADLSVKRLMEGKDSYEVINDIVQERINGMDAMVNEIEASMLIGDSLTVNVYYMLGVFRGEKAFYQVLTWTLLNQKEDFKADMRRMIYSFEEI